MNKLVRYMNECSSINEVPDRVLQMCKKEEIVLNCPLEGTKLTIVKDAYTVVIITLWAVNVLVGKNHRKFLESILNVKEGLDSK